MRVRPPSLLRLRIITESLYLCSPHRGLGHRSIPTGIPHLFKSSVLRSTEHRISFIVRHAPGGWILVLRSLTANNREQRCSPPREPRGRSTPTSNYFHPTLSQPPQAGLPVTVVPVRHQCYAQGITLPSGPRLTAIPRTRFTTWDCSENIYATLRT